MLRWFLAAFLAAHGLVHILVWTNRKLAAEQGTTPDHSWLIGSQPAVVIGLTYLTAGLFVAAGGALIFELEIWRALTIAAAAVSLLLVALFPEALVNLWILVPVGIDAALVAGIWLDWPTRTMVGA